MAAKETTRAALIKHMKKGKGAHPDADVKKLVKASAKRPPMKAKAARGR